MSASASSASKSKTHHQNVEHKNFIKVKLKKPKSWNWELSTSKSSASIQFPEIQLYDHKNNFLASANDANLVFGNNTTVSTNLSKANVTTPTLVEKISPRSESTKRKHYPVSNDIREFIDELKTQMNRNGYECLIQSQNNDQSKGNGFTNRTFDNKTNVTSKVPMPNISYINVIDISNVKNCMHLMKTPQTESDDHNYHNDINTQNKNVLTIKKSKSTTAVGNTQTFDSKKVENKKKYRRTCSANSSMRFSSSILERLSMNKQCSSSSTDTLSNYADNNQDLTLQDEDFSEYKPPKYMLRSSHAGTLVVCKDSFLSHGKSRRRKTASVKDCNVSLIQESIEKFNNADDTTIQKSSKEPSHERQRGKMQRTKEILDVLSSCSSTQSDIMQREIQKRDVRRTRKLLPTEMVPSTNTGEYSIVLFRFIKS